MENTKGKLVRITSAASYVAGRINAGVIHGTENTCLVVDTGLDNGSAGKIAAALDAEGLRPAALLVTHTHADHCGGNAAMQQKYGVPAYGPPMEAAILSHPGMEPMYLYGAAPPDALRNKFFLAQPTQNARPLPPGRHRIGGISVTAVALPGHSPEHTGYLTDDGVLFSGDAMFPAYVWEKYRLPYFYDICAALTTLDALEALLPRLTACVAAHFGAVDTADLIAANRAGLLGMADWAAGVLKDGPHSREELTARAFTQFGLTPNEGQYYLVSSTVAALLTHLCRNGKVHARMKDGRLLYYPKQGDSE